MSILSRAQAWCPRASVHYRQAVSLLVMLAACASPAPPGQTQRRVGEGCAEHAQCMDQSLCVEGVCRAICNRPEDCPSELGCVDGTCRLCDTAEQCRGLVGCNHATGFCRASCNGLADCKPQAWCQGTACVPDLGLGEACHQAEMCRSGACVDAVCCEAACSATCLGCIADYHAGTDGACLPILAGLDPLNQCAGTAACDGAGACSDRALGEDCEQAWQCTSGHCVDGVCCESACADTCRSCALPGRLGQCRDVLNASDPPACVAPQVCDSQALCKLASAQPCQDAGQCSSGYCVDGVCCQGPCDGPCEYCDPTGACVASPLNSDRDGDCGACQVCDGLRGCTAAISYTDPKDDCGSCHVCIGADGCRPVPTGEDFLDHCSAQPVRTCGPELGVCDGAGACDFYSAGTKCGTTACVADGRSLWAEACDGLGHCSAELLLDCHPYRCGTDSYGSACRWTCSLEGDLLDPSSAGCAPGYYCEFDPITCGASGENPLGLTPCCVPRKERGTACLFDDQCTDDHCADGYCCESACDAPCHACNFNAATGQCLAEDCGIYACNAAGGDCHTDCDSGGALNVPDHPACREGATCYRADTAVCSVVGHDCCYTPLPLGEACTPSTAYRCPPPHACVDGVCCASTCSEPCKSCNIEGSEGTCTADPDGTKPGCEGCRRCVGGTCGFAGFGTDCGQCKQCDGLGGCVNMHNVADTAGVPENQCNPVGAPLCGPVAPGCVNGVCDLRDYGVWCGSGSTCGICNGFGDCQAECHGCKACASGACTGNEPAGAGCNCGVNADCPAILLPGATSAYQVQCYFNTALRVSYCRDACVPVLGRYYYVLPTCNGSGLCTATATHCPNRCGTYPNPICS